MQRELPFAVLERDLELPVNTGQMITISGVRRCGKSSMMKIVANKLLANGVDPSKILWINFDDERLDGMSSEEFDDILAGYREMYPENDLADIYIFFDEIQNIANWELFVIRLYKSYCKNIYLSGSSAKMLSSQIATALRGWPLEYEAFPLSFGEYLRFKGKTLNEYDEAHKAVIKNMCRDYLHSSAFPEVVLMEEESLKIRKVQGYYNTMLFRDLVEHYKLPNVEIVKYLLKRMMLNITKPTSINAIYNDLKSQGRKVDKNKLYDFAQMACDSFMFYKVNKWSKSFINETSRLPKYYFIDNGMRNSLLMPQSDDDGKLLENAVYMHLRRHLDPMRKITYYSEESECDFVVQHDESIELLIQVCWEINDNNTLNRELRGLNMASKRTNCTNCLIITMEDETSVTVDNTPVKVVPAWKWLMKDPFLR